ncbi:hypothetical protein CLV63_111205 [Murinocardiopsis flavida]|uniref:Subtilisin inhibitor-like n=1 Tax=Murinocardiopsis flavida TaxID=645275 RepID=A0A2P8DHF5_9ACTN|nr:hypothetical protein [Murinocardiopsis flavida]PSK96609.1 hypothetical protein CLV63_111205 [Murinocardiopsis flavida]
MSKLNLPRRTSGGLAPALLGGACVAGALGYSVIVGASLLPTDLNTPDGAQADTVSGLSRMSAGPKADLQIQVTDRTRAYIQNVVCTGDTRSDPGACAALERIDKEEVGDPFEEVSKAAVCTDQTYGAQSAAVTGTWKGRAVDTQLNREGSCEEARWQKLTPVTDPLS